MNVSSRESVCKVTGYGKFSYVSSVNRHHFQDSINRPLGSNKPFHRAKTAHVSSDAKMAADNFVLL